MEKIFNILKGIPHWLASLMGLTGLAVLAYGRLVWTGGLFGDDPSILYAYHRLGSAGFDAFFGWARPYSAWIYKILVPIMGKDLHVFQAVTLLVRVISSWMLYLLLNALFYTEWFSTVAAVICLIYPGFTQQAHALQFLLHFMVLAVALLSLYTMVRSVRTEDNYWRWIYLVLSLLTACVHISIEYFVGLEFLRSLILAIAWKACKEEKRSFKQMVFTWLPYGGLLCMYLIWRALLFQPAYPPIRIFNNFSQSPLTASLELAGRIAWDIWKVGFSAWGKAFNLPLNHSIDLMRVVAALLLSVLVWIMGSKIEVGSGANQPQGKKWSFILLGAAGLVLGGIPLWASQLPLTITYPWNRTTLCFLVGVSIFTAGMIALLPKKIGRIVCALLIGFSIVFQIRVGADYQSDWGKVRSYFTQLAAQAPDIEPDTLVLYDDLPIKYYSANNLNSFLNWIYDPDRGNGPERYKMFEISERLGNLLPSLERGVEVAHNAFHGNTDRTLVIAVDSVGCLFILPPDGPEEFALPEMTASARHLSDPEALINEQSTAAILPEILASEVNTPVCESAFTNE